MAERYEKLKNIVNHGLSYAAHDLDHVLRVCHYCQLLAESEKDVDAEVLMTAALLHDIARRQEDEDRTGEIDHALLGATMAGNILQDLNYDAQFIEKVRKCIRSHRFRSGFLPESIEARILFDADKLDVLGAVGIARSYMLAGEHGERMYQDTPLTEYLAANVGENGRIKDVSKHAANLEFELKLKKIPVRLYTEKAKEMAKNRIKYMEDFFRVLQEEITGKK